MIYIHYISYIFLMLQTTIYILVEKPLSEKHLVKYNYHLDFDLDCHQSACDSMIVPFSL